MKACTSPGSTRLRSPSPPCNEARVTVGMACSLDQDFSDWLAITRPTTPVTAMRPATQTAAMPISFRRWLDILDDVGWVSSGIGFSGLRRGVVGLRVGCVAGGLAAVDDGEHHRHEQQGGEGGADQAADHRAAERRVLLAI